MSLDNIMTKTDLDDYTTEVKNYIANNSSDEKVTPVTTNPTSVTGYNIPFVSGTSNQQPKVNDGLHY